MICLRGVEEGLLRILVLRPYSMVESSRDGLGWVVVEVLTILGEGAAWAEEDLDSRVVVGVEEELDDEEGSSFLA